MLWTFRVRWMLLGLLPSLLPGLLLGLLPYY